MPMALLSSGLGQSFSLSLVCLSVLVLDLGLVLLLGFRLGLCLASEMSV